MAIITGADLAAHLGIPDTEDDSALDLAANAACTAVAEHCGRTFDKTALSSETARIYRVADQLWVATDDFWSITNLAVKTDDNDDGVYETTWTINTDFILEPLNRRYHGQDWAYNRIVAVGTRWFPSWNRRPAVQVTAAWGWETMPYAVKQAALIKAAKLFKRRNSAEGVLGGFGDFGPVRVSNREDPDVVALLAPYRHADVAAMVG